MGERYVLVKEDVEQLENEVDKSEKRSERRKMLVGRSFDTESARDRWIDSVERLLENESFERGEKHMRTNFGSVRHDGYYGLDEVPRWML